MKNFLKSTAIFACVALLFGACTEDETEDVGGTTSGGDYIEEFVEAPTNVAVQPGNGVAVLTFTAAVDDDISYCSVAWVNNENSADSGSKKISVTPSGGEEYVDEELIITGLSAGTYTVSVTSIMDGSNKLSEVVSEEVAVYDESTYTSQIPEITRMVYDSELGVTIYLESVSRDCASLDISYYTDNGNYTSTTTASVDITDPDVGTLLSGAQLGENYTLVGYFKPTGGYDYVEVRSQGTFESDENLSYVDGAAADPGYKRIMVYWDLSAVAAENIDATYISCINTSDASAVAKEIVFTDWNFASDNITQKMEFSGLAAGNYTVSIYNAAAGDAQVNVSTISGIMVYDESSFSLPEINSISYKSDGVVYIDWVESPAHITAASISYLKSGETAATELSITDLSSTTILSEGAEEGSEIIISATYRPSYAVSGADSEIIDYVDLSTIVGEGTVIPLQYPVAPVGVSMTTGYDAASEDENNSYINVAWTAVGDVDVDQITVYYSTNTYSYTAFVVTENVSTATGCTIPALAADATYSVYVVSQRVDEDGVVAAESEFTDEDKFSVLTYNEATYASSLPTYSALAHLATGELEITWNEDSFIGDFTSLTITASDASTTTISASAEKTTLAVSVDAASFTYYAEFTPAGGIEPVKVESEEIAIPEMSPAVPTSVVVSSYGYNETDGSYAIITWEESSESPTITNVNLYAVTSDGGTTAVQTLEAGVKTYKFTGLSADKSYTFYVATLTASETISDYVATSPAVTTYAPSSYSLPTYSYMYDSGVTTVTWSGLDEDITSLTVTYNGAAQTTITDFSGTVTSTIVCGGADDGYPTTFTYAATFKPSSVIAQETVELTGGEGSFVIPDYDIIYNDGTYEIYSALGLAAFADIVNGTTSYLTKATLGGFTSSVSQNTAANAKMIENVDLSSICSATAGNWTPMAVYAGTFDGNGKTISNLYYVDADTSTHAFVISLTGTLKDIIMDSPQIVGVGTNAVYATVTSGLIDGCSVTGTGYVTGSAANNAGIASQLAANSTIKNCYVGSGMTITGGYSSASSADAAGIVGYVRSGTSIIGCHNAATVEGKRTIGGIVGYSSAVDYDIIGCGNSGTIACSGSNAGGIGGRHLSSGTVNIVGFYNTGNITSTGQSGNLYGATQQVLNLYGIYCAGTGFAASGDGLIVGYTSTTINATSCYYNGSGTTTTALASTSNDSVYATAIEGMTSVTGLTAEVIAAMNAAITAYYSDKLVTEYSYLFETGYETPELYDSILKYDVEHNADDED